MELKMTNKEIMLLAGIISLVLVVSFERPKAMECVTYITDNRGLHHEIHGAMEAKL
jgi:hypothetical protein